MVMTHEEEDNFYRKLEFYKAINKKVHIRIWSGEDSGLFRNGYILDISKDKRIFIFIDDVLGERPYLFEEVDPNIIPFKPKDEDDDDR